MYFDLAAVAASPQDQCCCDCRALMVLYILTVCLKSINARFMRVN